MSIFYGSKSKTGIPCLGVGGGAHSNTVIGRVVLRDGQPAPAIFIRNRGDLACHLDQGVVPIKLGDVVVEVEGRLPVASENPDLVVKHWKVVGIRDPRPSDRNSVDENVVIEVEPTTSDVPDLFAHPRVIEGLSAYHNRDGTLFVSGWGGA